MSVDVFISYHSASSQEIAKTIKNRLENNGYTCWYSGKDMGGGDYASGIMQALTQCRIFVLILNKASSESAHVLNELEIVTNRLARKEEVTIIPFQVVKEEISPAAQYYISRHHWLDATKMPMDKSVTELVDQVSALLNTEEDIQDMETARKKEKWHIFGKVVFTLLAAAGLVYGYRTLPVMYEEDKIYYLIHILLTSAPMLLLMFENHEKTKTLGYDFANYMIIAAVLIFIVRYFDLRTWEQAVDFQRMFKIIKQISASDFTKEVIFHGGSYLLLVLYPGHRDLMKTGNVKLFWTLVSLVTAMWMAVNSCLIALTAMQTEGNLSGICLCLWGVIVGAYIIYHNIAERRALKNK